DRRRSGSRAGRCGAVPGRPLLLRLLHVSLQPPCGGVSCRYRARRLVAHRLCRRQPLAARRSRRDVDGNPGHSRRGGARAPARQRRRRRRHQARPAFRQGARRPPPPRPHRPRTVCRARQPAEPAYPGARRYRCRRRSLFRHDPAGRAESAGRGRAMTDFPAGAAIVMLGASAFGLARRLQPILPNSSLHAPTGKGIAADRLCDDAADHIASLFRAGTPIVGICAAGILIRAVGRLLADKRGEPPVIAVAEDGSAVVPLLGGHRGANRVSRAIAEAIDGAAAITTAGDLVLGFALDEPPAGWRVANAERLKPIAAALLAGVPVALHVDAGTADWLTSGTARFSDSAALGIRVTDRAAAPGGGDLILNPPVLALGVGCERGCAAEELIALAEETLAEHGLADGAVAAIVSLDLKSDEPAVHALAARFGVPARFFSV